MELENVRISLLMNDPLLFAYVLGGIVMSYFKNRIKRNFVILAAIVSLFAGMARGRKDEAEEND